MTISGEFLICNINKEFAILQSAGEEIYYGRRETLRYEISQSKKEKEYERICSAKENGPIAIKFCGSQPFKRPSIFFMMLLRYFNGEWGNMARVGYI